MKLENGAWVAVCDGGKFLLLQNHGDQDILDLRVIAQEKIDEAAYTGRADRGPSPNGSLARTGRAHRRSVEDEAELRFVESIALEIETRILSGTIGNLTLIADPKSLGLMRDRIKADARAKISHEIGTDLAHRTVAEIETLLASY